MVIPYGDPLSTSLEALAEFFYLIGGPADGGECRALKCGSREVVHGCEMNI